MCKILFCFCFLLSKIISFGQCDNTLKPADNAQVAYKARGNRCEGEYSAQVGAPSLDVVGFTIGIFSYNLVPTESIKITNLDTVINLRASAIPLNTYYRMDAVLSTGTTFTWDIKDVLLNLRIPSNSLGIYGWFGTERNKIFVPIKPISTTYDTSKHELYFIVRASTKVLKIEYRYSKIGQNPGQYEQDNSSFRTGEPITIKLPANLKGTYTIDIAALLQSNGNWIAKKYTLSIR
jgi:hypothetical protein